MIKQISTYGAALLTAMVVIRAATMEEQKDVSNLYQRAADVTYVNDNLALRDNYKNLKGTTDNLLSLNIRAKVEFSKHKSLPAIVIAVEDEELALVKPEDSSIESVNIIPSDLVLLNEEADLDITENLSLDRENTINSGLSVIFNRQRIHPKPSAVALQE
tara:strand:- start:39 stop:518 length:480 start_codon:yes stop_codon:yes gene_type:complete